MLRKTKLAPSPICNCGIEDQTAEHILQRCPLLQTARRNVWPTAVLLHTKPYAACRNWRRWPHSSCRLDFQCSGDWEEVHRAECVQADPVLYCIHNCSTQVKHLVYFQFVVPCYSIFSVKFHNFFPVVTKNVSNLAVGVPNYKKVICFLVFSECLSSTSECSRKAVGQYPHCSDCTMFIKCFGSSGNLFTCPTSLFYDVNDGVCNFPALAVCGYVFVCLFCFVCLFGFVFLSIKIENY